MVERAGSSLALGIDGGMNRFARNTLSVRQWKVAGAWSSMAFCMDGSVIKLAGNTLFVRWWVAGRGLLWRVAWVVE